MSFLLVVLHQRIHPGTGRLVCIEPKKHPGQALSVASITRTSSFELRTKIAFAPQSLPSVAARSYAERNVWWNVTDLSGEYFRISVAGSPSFSINGNINQYLNNGCTGECAGVTTRLQLFDDKYINSQWRRVQCDLADFCRLESQMAPNWFITADVDLYGDGVRRIVMRYNDQTDASLWRLMSASSPPPSPSPPLNAGGEGEAWRPPSLPGDGTDGDDRDGCAPQPGCARTQRDAAAVPVPAGAGDQSFWKPTVQVGLLMGCLISVFGCFAFRSRCKLGFQTRSWAVRSRALDAAGSVAGTVDPIHAQREPVVGVSMVSSSTETTIPCPSVVVGVAVPSASPVAVGVACPCQRPMTTVPRPIIRFPGSTLGGHRA